MFLFLLDYYWQTHTLLLYSGVHLWFSHGSSIWELGTLSHMDYFVFKQLSFFLLFCLFIWLFFIWIQTLKYTYLGEILSLVHVTGLTLINHWHIILFFYFLKNPEAKLNVCKCGHIFPYCVFTYTAYADRFIHEHKGRQS